MITLSLATAFLHESLHTLHQRPLILGISGPQGLGKLYLAEKLLAHIQSEMPNLTAVQLLADDFYLTHDEQMKVTRDAQREGNSVLQGRGLPGTHDLPLMVQTLDKLANGEACKVPVYDKSAYGGEGDRLPEALWQDVLRRCDVVIFEGWFLGFRAIDEALFPSAYLTQPVGEVVQRSTMHHLATVNAKLREYEPLWVRFGCFICLQTNDIDNVYVWRLQQEAALIASRGLGMTDDAVRRFVDRYMPMYYLYYWRMCRDGVEGRNLRIDIDAERGVTGSTVFQA